MADERQSGAWTPERVGPVALALVEAARAAGVGFAVTLDDGDEIRNVYASEALAEMLGYTVEELLAVPVFSHIPDDERAKLVARRERRLRGEELAPRFETVAKHKSGALVPIEVAVAMGVPYAGELATVAFVFDLTDRRRSETALSRSEERFRRLIDRAPEAIAIARGWSFVYANQALVTLLGYPSMEALLAAPIQDHIHPEDAPTVRQRIERVIRGEAPPPLEYRVRRCDGHYIALEVASMMIEYEGAPAILGFGRDVTERKRLQQQLLDADRLAAIGTLAAGIAHEVNNPLAYVLLNLDEVAREIPRLLEAPEQLASVMERLMEARQGADRVATIVRDLRVFSSRQSDDTRGAVDVRRVLASAVNMAWNEIRHRARLVTDYRDVPLVLGNAPRLEQVFLNLLVNAAQALSEADMQKNEVRLTTRFDAGRVIVEVNDNGVGIDPEIIGRIFDPFFTTKPIGVGMGLGLSICHGIVKSLGGELAVESKLGAGTRFRVSLVALTPFSPTIPAPPVRPLEPMPKARVLIIDDEHVLATALSRALEEHEVQIATTARDGLHVLLGDGEFDVVFCDLMMPGMTGMDLHAELRRARPGAEERLVFMTGGAFTPRAREFLDSVSNPRVDKPFDVSKIREAVLHVVGRR